MGDEQGRGKLRMHWPTANYKRDRQQNESQLAYDMKKGLNLT